MHLITILLFVAIATLMIDSLLEMAFISSMVYWLNHGASGPYEINRNGRIFSLHSAPRRLLTDQGHTSNGAAGTAFVLIGLGGIVALLLARPLSPRHRLLGWLYRAWLVLTVPATLLTLAALIYVNVVTSKHSGQTIDLDLVVSSGVPYPVDSWTPQNWFSAVLKLPLTDDDTESKIAHHLRIMNGWRWNLIPLFVIELGVCVLAFVEARMWRRRGRYAAPAFQGGVEAK